MAKSIIEWTESTWNPLTGCTKISPGCEHCYAERMSKRLQAMGQRNYSRGFEINMHEHALEIPLNWKKPQIVFVNSMSDLFHEQVPDSFIKRVFKIMRQAHWHNFQVLTKRESRLEEMSSSIEVPKNVWMGVRVEYDQYTSRIDHLRRTKASVKFLSLEPLLDSLEHLNLGNIDWVIVGGESGPKARPMHESWVCSIRDQCQAANVPFFFKQWGGVNKRKAGRLLNGRTWDEMPLSQTAFDFGQHDKSNYGTKWGNTR